jgi:hypothetical protein
MLNMTVESPRIIHDTNIESLPSLIQHELGSLSLKTQTLIVDIRTYALTDQFNYETT